MPLLSNLSKAVAIVVHPVVMPIYCTLFALFCVSPWATLPSGVKTYVLLSVGFGACLVPLMIMGLLVLMGRVSDFEMPTRQERVLPVALTSVATAMCSGVLALNGMPYAIVVIVLCLCVLTLIATFVTPRWKISLHGMGVGGLLAYVSMLGIQSRTDFFVPVAIAIVLAGLAVFTHMPIGAPRSLAAS